METPCLASRSLQDRRRNLRVTGFDTLKGSRHNNMKELRPGSTGRTEIRVLFAFDLERRAILLVGGDKRDDWERWYESNIPIADDRFDEHQAKLAEERTKSAPSRTASRRRTSRRKR